MNVDNDGIDDAMTDVTRIALAAAARVGEQLAKDMERLREEARVRSEMEARELEQRMIADRQAAEAWLRPIHHKDWWDKASEAEVVQAYSVARAWSRESPEIARTEQHMLSEVKERWGISMPELEEQCAVREALASLDRILAEIAAYRDERAKEAAVKAQEAREQSAQAWAHAAKEQMRSEGESARGSLSEESLKFVEEMRARGINVLDLSVDKEKMMEAVEEAARAAHLEGRQEVESESPVLEAEVQAVPTAEERRAAEAERLKNVQNEKAVNARIVSDQCRQANVEESAGKGKGPSAKTLAQKLVKLKGKEVEASR